MSTQNYTLIQGNNGIEVTCSNATYCELKKNLNIVGKAKSSTVTIINAIFRPLTIGDYVIETDGTIDSIIAKSVVNAEEDFDVGLCLYRLSQEFTNIERMNLSKIAPTFISKIQTKNFVELKELLDYLVDTTAELTTADRTKVKNILLEQSIDLDTY